MTVINKTMDSNDELRCYCFSAHERQDRVWYAIMRYDMSGFAVVTMYSLT